jgi:Tfp pilus assembly protein PilX
MKKPVKNRAANATPRAGVLRRRGALMISTLFLLLILSVLLMGVGTFAASHQQRAKVDTNYAVALDMAEAGINTEFNWISQSGNSGHTWQNNGTNPPGSGPYTLTTALGTGQYWVYCTTNPFPTSGNPPSWTKPNPGLYVVSTGVFNGTRRTVVVSAKGYGSTTADYAIYGVDGGIMNGGGSGTINGTVGSNGKFTFNGQPNINGEIDFNGSAAGWQNAPQKLSSYTIVYNTDPVPWPTVSSIANSLFPSGGLNWLKTNNDNATASPPIINGNITSGGDITLYGKPGGSNYYLDQVNLNGNDKIIFNNTSGPINVWLRPNNGGGSCDFRGGGAAIAMSQDSTKPCKIYFASTGDLHIKGNYQMDAGIYGYDGSSTGKVIFDGNPTVYGAVICEYFILNGSPTINKVSGMFVSGSGPNYYGYNDFWSEQGLR